MQVNPLPRDPIEVTTFTDSPAGPASASTAAASTTPSTPVLSPAAPESRTVRRAALLVLAAVIVTGAALRLWFATTLSMHMDEMFTRSVARLPFDIGWRALQYDLVHPPGYYLLQRATYWVLPDRPYTLMVLPLLASMATIGVVARVTWRSGSALAAAGGAALVALSAFQANYAVTGRSYAMTTLLVCVLAALLVFRPTRLSIVEWLVVLALGLLHYFGPIYAGSLLLGMLVARGNWKPFGQRAVAYALAALPLLAWVIAEIPVLRMKRGLSVNLGWAGQPTLDSVVWTLAYLMNAPEVPRGAIITAAMMLLCAAAFFASGAHHEPAGRHAMIPAVGALLPPVAIGAAAMQTAALPVFVLRQFLASQALFALAFALAAAAVLARCRRGDKAAGRRRWLFVFPFAAAWIWMMTGATSRLRDVRSAEYRDAANVIAARLRVDSMPVLSTWSYGAGDPVSYYLDARCLPLPPTMPSLPDTRSSIDGYASHCLVREIARDREGNASLPPRFLLLVENTVRGKTVRQWMPLEGRTVDTLGVYDRGNLELWFVHR